MKARSDLLSNLPDEVLLEIANSAPITTRINLANASSRFQLLFFDEHKPALNVLRQLLSHAALGEWSDAESLWTLFPDLLTCRGSIYHPNRSYVNAQQPIDIPFAHNPGRYHYINLTAWQIAMVNETYDVAEHMGKWMTREEMQKQFAEIFPDGNLIKYDWQIEKAKGLLQIALDAIMHDQMITEGDFGKINKVTQKALDKLYHHVKPSTEHRTGLVFDVNFYLEALALLDSPRVPFDNIDKYSFWCIRVVEWLAGCLGTAYLLPHSQGMGNSTTPTGCTLADGSSYFAFRRQPTSIPGLHFFVDHFGGRTNTLWNRRPPSVRAHFLAQKSVIAENRDRLLSALFPSTESLDTATHTSHEDKDPERACMVM